VIGVGPQIGVLFAVGNLQGYINLKGYAEFDNQNRPDGWNAWITFAACGPADNSLLGAGWPRARPRPKPAEITKE
jgi:hypothetical protein